MIIDLEKKLQKLLILSRRGIGGEKRNAKQMLLSMLKKYGLTVLDIEGEREYSYWFKWHDEFDRRLLDQIMYKILGKNADVFTSRKKRKQYSTITTAIKKMEIEIEHEVYGKALKEGLKIYYRAFIEKNHIFPMTSSSSKKEMTPEQEQEISEIIRMARNIKKTNIMKLIT